MSDIGLKKAMSQWIEDHIKCVTHNIKDFKPPFSTEQLEAMKIPVAELRLLYSLINRFNIDIDYKIYDKFENFANLRL